MKNSFSQFTPDELAHAIELMVAPEDLMQHDVMVAVLKALSYTPQEVAEQLASGEKLDDGKPVVWRF